MENNSETRPTPTLDLMLRHALKAFWDQEIPKHVTHFFDPLPSRLIRVGDVHGCLHVVRYISISN